MEVATYAPYRRNTFAPEYNPHYAQYQVPRAHPAMTAHYQSAPQQAPRQTQATVAAATSQAVDDANKPSLPSISNLLGIADGDRASLPSQETSSPSQAQAQQVFYTSAPPDHAYNQGFVTVADPVSNARGPLVPTPPPVRSDSVVDAAHSPASMGGQAYYLGSSLNNLEANQQRNMAMKRHSIPMPNGAMYTTSPYGLTAYNSSPSAMSTSSYYSADGVYGLYQQRPLPSNFPPVMAGAVMAPSAVAAPNPWEHHHYIAPSSQTAYPQAQDRYVCQTCNKAFSRPSSLKIHSYSHTGEKPFKCPQQNCGKAFSVRSNMKRHERGCHGGTSNIMA